MSSHKIGNKLINNNDLGIETTNTKQMGGSLESLSVPFGLLLLNQYLPVDSSKNIYDIQTHNYLEEDSINTKSTEINKNDSIDDSLYDKLLNMLNISKEIKEKSKTRKKRKRKNRVTKKIY